MDLKNLKLHDIIEIKIENIANGGEGIGRYNNFVVFVPFAAVNDVLEVQIIDLHKNFARAKIVDIKTSSQDRINPKCKFYYKCGGCNFMHIQYDKQVEYKEKFVIDVLERIGDVRKDKYIWDGIQKCSNDFVFGYRNKLQMPFSVNQNGEAYIGFFAKNTHTVVNIDECLAQPSILNVISKEFVKLVNEYKMPIYDEKISNNGLRHLCFRINKNNKILITIVGTYEFNQNNKVMDNIIKIADLIAKKFAKTKNITGIFYNQNSKNTNFIFGDKFFQIFGIDELNEKIGNINYKISSASFFQVNSYIAEKLYLYIKKFFELDGAKNVLDLYCGSGGIGLFIADTARKVVGVEVEKSAVQKAVQTAQENDIKNVKYYNSKVEDILADLCEKNFDSIILNPPRKGIAKEVIGFIEKISPLNIVYVSCNPSTLARDIKRLKGVGYNLNKAKAFDMFPQTSNVETVAFLVKN